MQYSVVNYKTVKGLEIVRFDAEYFHPDYLYIADLIKKKEGQFVSLKQLKIKCDASAFYPTLEPYYRQGNTPFIRVADVDDGINYDQILKIPKQILSKYKTLKLGKKGDIVLTKGGSIARAGLVIKDSALTRDLIFFNTSKLSEDDYIFYYVYCLTDFYKKQLVQSSSMTAQPHLTITLVRNICFFNPNKKFKDLVVSVFKKSFVLLGQSEFLYSHAEQLFLSELGLLDWKLKHELDFVKNFSDTQQAERFDAEYFQPKYEGIIEAVKKYKGGFDELGNLVRIKKSVEPGSEAYQENGIPFVRVSNLSKFELSTNNQQFISKGLYEKLKTHQPKQGEILLSKDATPGMAYCLDEEPQKMIVSGGILRLKIDSKQVLSEYLTLVLNSVVVQKQIERDAGGSIINHWRPDQVKATKIPILKEDKQQEIKKLVEKSFNNRKLSKSLLEIAKRAVEMAIEEDEKTAINWIDSKIKKLRVKI